MRRRLLQKTLALSRTLATGAEWEQLVRDEFALLAPCEGWRRSAVEQFHRLYYDEAASGGTWKDTRWFGVPAQKCPLDLWAYQELLHEQRPDLVIETGTADGGSGYYLAMLCDLLHKGSVVSVDIEDKPGRPRHDRLTYITGSSTDPAVFARVEQLARGCRTVVAILDSDHSYGHVLDELRLYGALVTPGSYLVVEDTNINGHPVYPEFGPGPMEAVQDFLKGGTGWRADRSREKLLLTFNPGGWLEKLR